MPYMRLCLLAIIFVAINVPAAEFTGHAGETWKGSRDENGIYSFKGLPFAAAPVGELRWRPPAPYQPTGGEKLAQKFAAACMRADHIESWYRELIKKLDGDPNSFEGPNGSSEDCLYLNIWTPTMNQNAGLPVMIWIHAGSNKSGWSYEPDYRGSELAKEQVVVISVAYRLGAFSMFALPELISEQGGAAANYGLLDLVAALEFVKQHARAFGGNPKNVTLFGESAGAENIAALMSNPGAEALFHKAIHQSGSALSKYELDDVMDYSERLAGARNIGELRAMSAHDFYNLQSSEKNPELGFAPFAGGHGLPENNLYETLKSKPLLIGTNDHEWLMYLSPNASLKDTARELGIDLTESQLREKLPGLSDQHIVDRLVTARYMYCPSIKLADNVSTKHPVYFYLFERIRESDYGQRVGAYHGAEIPYIFNSHDTYLETNERDLRLSKVMISYWTNFARYGDPNDAELKDWPKYTQESQKVLKLGVQQTSVRARDLWMCK